MVSVLTIGTTRAALYELLDDKIPGSDLEWDGSDAQEKFRLAGVQLVGLGMTAEEAVEFLFTLYWVVAGSFGA